MRTLISTLVLVAACSVPDKQPGTATDGGTDSGSSSGGTPETTITSAPAMFSNSGTAQFVFESNQPDARFTCSLDGEAPTACSSPFVRDLPDGTHSFSVRAISSTGDGDDTPAEHLWSIDTVAPETTLSEAPPAADNSTMVHFSFMSNEMNVTFECSLDSAAFTPCRSGDDFGPVTDGAHAFAVRAVDRAGNVDASPAVHAWSVDTSTPDTTLLSGPAGASGSATATFTFLSPDAGPGATFECSRDGSPFAACTSPVTYSGLSMGVHTFAVRVRDANGNVDPTPATRTWTVDLTPPETTITQAPSGTVAMASASISFTSNENDVTYACNLDNGGFMPCTSPFTVQNLAQGAHTFAVAATDMAGHTDPSPATVTWTVDTVTPDLALTAPAEGATVGPRIAISWTASEGTVECRLDGGAWMPCTSPLSFSHAAGTVTFEIRATDAAGNVTMLTRTFTVACTAPDATGAAGLLHLDDNAQTLTNATGGAGATLGTTTDVETVDPSFVAGRFGMALSFNAAEGDIVTWPIGIGLTSSLSLELWAQPSSLSGTRTLVQSADGRFALRVTLASSGGVQFSATVIDGAGVLHTVTSTAVAASAWHQVTVALSPTALTIYVDGAATTLAIDRVDLSFDTLQIGSTYGGLVDEIYVTTTTLDASTVLARYCPAM